jgi:hypothetical protein
MRQRTRAANWIIRFHKPANTPLKLLTDLEDCLTLRFLAKTRSILATQDRQQTVENEVLSRRDCPIVARHEVPGMCKKKEPVPEGRCDLLTTQQPVCRTSFVHPKLHNMGDRRVEVLHHPVPPGRPFLLPLPRHFMPGYNHAVPPGQNFVFQQPPPGYHDSQLRCRFRLLASCATKWTPDKRRSVTAKAR